jgi:hypothetical protein
MFIPDDDEVSLVPCANATLIPPLLPPVMKAVDVTTAARNPNVSS